MKRLLIVAVLLAATAAPALAGGGQIVMYQDGAYTGCPTFVDVAGQVVNVYVIHELSPAVSASQFRIAINGYTGTLIDVTFPILYIVDPDIFGGDTVPYGACKTTPYTFAIFTLWGLGTSPDCSSFQVVADPHTGGGAVLAFDCEGGSMPAIGGTLYVNPTDACGCPLGTESSTWGQIKSLYANEGR